MSAGSGAARARRRAAVPAAAGRLLLVVALLLAAGCAVPPSRAAERDPLDVVATMSVFAEFARAVGGDLVSVETLVPVGGDPHTFEPVPSDAAKIARADIVLDNGLGLSPWFEPLAGNARGDVVLLTERLAAEAEARDGKLDPHLWMVPPLVVDGYVPAIVEAFARADPAHADVYAANAARYRRELAALDRRLSARVATIPPAARKLVTSHDAYSYFADHFGLEVVGTAFGVTTEQEPSARQIARLIDEIRAQDVPAVFLETTVNPDLVERVARDAGVQVGAPLYGDSVGEPGSGAEDYVGMMEANVDAIVTALGGRAR